MDFIRILVVDDVFTNRLLLAELIKTTGNEVVLVENGEEAIKVLNEQEIHLIFMDIEMPVMNGIETTNFIREQMTYPINALPIVALTAHNPDIFFEDFADVGFDDLITKPYSAAKIKEKIDAVLLSQ